MRIIGLLLILSLLPFAFAHEEELHTDGTGHNVMLDYILMQKLPLIVVGVGLLALVVFAIIFFYRNKKKAK